MTLAFITNYFNHHQREFCDELYSALNDNFHMIVCRKITEDRIKLGYPDYNNATDYVVRYYENAKLAEKICLNVDVLVFGSAPLDLLNKRLKNGKLTFVYTERLFKRWPKDFFNPLLWRNFYKKYGVNKKNNVFYLCAGSYVKADINLFDHNNSLFFKWGYFPKTYKYDIDTLLKNKEHKSLLWVGRMIDWKHPELAIDVIKYFKNKKINLKLRVIGCGELENSLRLITQKYNLTDQIEFLGSMSPNYVRKYMEISDIFLFTSDYNEGWGVVLNEAMNAGCTVIASRKAGATKFLVKNGINGYTFKSKKELLGVVSYCLKTDQNSIKNNAYNTIINDWNPSIASKRIIDISQRLLMGKTLKSYDNVGAELR